MNNNHILARWRDAAADPPPGGWIGLNAMANGARYYGACGHMPGDQWLDVTTIPAVRREAVQAAVDEMERLLETAKRSCRQNYISSFERALDVITDHTGVTPMEVPYGTR